MIVAKTNMKKIPKSCTKCRFVKNIGYTNAPTGNFTFLFRKCYLTNEEIPYKYIKEKNNWCYIKPNNCPLIDE